MKKKIIAGVLALLLVGGGVPCCNYFTQHTAIVANAEFTVIPMGNINYTPYDEYVRINYLNFSGHCPEEVEFPSQIEGKPVEVIGNGGKVFNSSWYESDVKKIKIPNTVKTISSNAFDSCYNAESIEIPSSVTSIDDYAFKGCASLLSLSIPTSGDSLIIGDGAFIGCSNLTNITLPDSINTLQTFSDSGSIIPTNESGKSVDYGAEIGFFEKCSKLRTCIHRKKVV